MNEFDIPEDRCLHPIVLRERLKAFAMYAFGRPAGHQAIEQGVQWITEEPDLLVQDWNAPVRRGGHPITIEEAALRDRAQPEPAPADGTIDHDALAAALHVLEDSAGRIDGGAAFGAVLELVRPAEGVVLTPEQARTVAAFIHDARGASFTGDLQHTRDLLKRLEAAS